MNIHYCLCCQNKFSDKVCIQITDIGNLYSWGYGQTTPFQIRFDDENNIKISKISIGFANSLCLTKCGKLFKCDNIMCNKIHIPPYALTTTIIGMLLCIYQKHSSNYALEKFQIKDNQFILAYNHSPNHNPLPNMNADKWRRLFMYYNRYYIDYDYQFGGPENYNKYKTITLWYVHEKDKYWYINIQKPQQFFIDKTCKYYTEKSVQIRDWGCPVQPLHLCRYYHWQVKSVVLYGHCYRWHIDLNTRLQIPYSSMSFAWPA